MPLAPRVLHMLPSEQVANRGAITRKTCRLFKTETEMHRFHRSGEIYWCNICNLIFDKFAQYIRRALRVPLVVLTIGSQEKSCTRQTITRPVFCSRYLLVLVSRPTVTAAHQAANFHCLEFVDDSVLWGQPSIRKSLPTLRRSAGSCYSSDVLLCKRKKTFTFSQSYRKGTIAHIQTVSSYTPSHNRMKH